MEEKKSEGIGNIYYAIGGALLGMGIGEQITKAILPAMEKLKSGEPLEQLKLLSGEQEKRDDSEENKKSEREHERENERKYHDNELAELKRELAEYKAKEKGQQE